MNLFTISDHPIQASPLIDQLRCGEAGALATFAGWVRNHNNGKAVQSLEYQVYEALAIKEGLKIIQEAKTKFTLHQAIAVHRSGHLEVGETAVWVGTVASHRQAAFAGTQYLIDQIKVRLPIWKKEFYLDHPAHWVYCREHQH